MINMFCFNEWLIPVDQDTLRQLEMVCTVSMAVRMRVRRRGDSVEWDVFFIGGLREFKRISYCSFFLIYMYVYMGVYPPVN
jgi:hypothetical protein